MLIFTLWSHSKKRGSLFSYFYLAFTVKSLTVNFLFCISINCINISLDSAVFVKCIYCLLSLFFGLY